MTVNTSSLSILGRLSQLEDLRVHDRAETFRLKKTVAQQGGRIINLEFRNSNLLGMNTNLVHHIRRNERPILLEVMQDTFDSIFYPTKYKRKMDRMAQKISDTEDELTMLRNHSYVVHAPLPSHDTVSVNVDDTSLVDVDING